MTKEFSERFSSVINCFELTPSDVADILHTSYQAVSSWMQGYGIPSLTEVFSFCLHYSVSADFLLGFSDNLNPVSKDAFTLPFLIERRLSGLTPEALDLVYDMIRYISVADDDTDLLDSFFLDSVYPKPHSSINFRKLKDLPPEVREDVEDYARHRLERYIKKTNSTAKEA